MGDIENLQVKVRKLERESDKLKTYIENLVKVLERHDTRLNLPRKTW